MGCAIDGDAAGEAGGGILVDILLLLEGTSPVAAIFCEATLLLL